MYVKFSYSFHVKMLITFVFISVQAGFNRNAADLLREYSHTGKNSNLNRYFSGFDSKVLVKLDTEVMEMKRPL
jgi:hypothetical protein